MKKLLLLIPILLFISCTTVNVGVDTQLIVTQIKSSYTEGYCRYYTQYVKTDGPNFFAVVCDLKIVDKKGKWNVGDTIYFSNIPPYNN